MEQINTIVVAPLIQPNAPPKHNLGKYNNSKNEKSIATPIGAVNPFFSKRNIFKKLCPVASERITRITAINNGIIFI